MANALVPDAATGADTMQQPMGPWEAQFARYLQPDPAWTYGSVLPLAQNNATGTIRPAVPGFLRDLGQGALQLLDGPATGGVTPQATNALAAMALPSVGSDGDALLSAGARGSNVAAKVPGKLYHVAGSDYKAGDDLSSLYSRYGNDAYDMFAAKWPESGDVVQSHPHFVMFHDNLPSAQEHADYLGGDIYQVDPKQIEGLQYDTSEGPGYWVTSNNVPASALKPVVSKK